MTETTVQWWTTMKKICDWVCPKTCPWLIIYCHGTWILKCFLCDAGCQPFNSEVKRVNTLLPALIIRCFKQCQKMMVPVPFYSGTGTENYLKDHLYCNRQCRTQSDQLCPQMPATHFSGINMFTAYVWHYVSKFGFPIPVRISTFTFISLCILHDITEIIHQLHQHRHNPTIFKILFSHKTVDFVLLTTVFRIVKGKVTPLQARCGPEGA